MSKTLNNKALQGKKALQTQKAQQRETLRLAIRHKRQQLSAHQQHTASLSLVHQLQALSNLTKGSTVALYLTNDGELNTTPLIQWFWQQRVNVVLPVLHPFKKGHLLFLNYQQSTVMKMNRYHIAEPVLAVSQVVPIQNIDVIFTPLVAFDEFGHRLGMGGGFYDRTLAGLYVSQQQVDNPQLAQKPRKPRKPHIAVIGLAHDCQQVARVPTEPWDIPLSTIVTPTRIMRASV